MYLRAHNRTKGGVTYTYWTLVESVRTARGPRQRTVGRLGKLPGLDRQERIGWEAIGRILAGETPETHPELFAEIPPVPEWATVDLRGVKVERVRRFGDVYLALALWRRLKLDDVLAQHLCPGHEDVPWGLLACVLVIARFCAPSSELAIVESFYGKTALEDLLGVPLAKINESRLYRALDRVLPHKDAVCESLCDRYRDWFGTGFDFLLYDVTSTYFEGLAEGNPQAQRGYSRDHRPDCKQVCIGLVVTPDGLPVGYEVFAGNRADVTTLEDIMRVLEDRYGKARRIWVFDRGIVSEDNLDILRSRHCQYLVGTPKPMLRRFEQELTEAGWQQVEAGVEVKTVRHPDFGDETFILCRSPARREKERAILQRQADRLEDKLRQIQHAIRQGRLRNREQAAQRMGRWMGRFSRAERLFETELVPSQGMLEDLVIRRRRDREAWANLVHGAYLLRSNLPPDDPATLWKQYIQLTQAEAAFRLGKSDLGLRPVYHQKEHRVQAHILVCFLALAMWKTLEKWMQARGMGSCARKLLAEMREIRSMDVILPVKDRTPVRIRVVGQPDRHVAELLHRLDLPVPNTGKAVEM